MRQHWKNAVVIGSVLVCIVGFLFLAGRSYLGRPPVEKSSGGDGVQTPVVATVSEDRVIPCEGCYIFKIVDEQEALVEEFSFSASIGERAIETESRGPGMAAVPVVLDDRGKRLSVSARAAGFGTASVEEVIPAELPACKNITVRLPRLASIELSVNTRGGTPEKMDVKVKALELSEIPKYSAWPLFFETRGNPCVFAQVVDGAACMIEGLEPMRTYAVRVLVKDYARATSIVNDLKPGEVRAVHVDLSGTGTLEIHVVNSDRQPAQGLLVEASQFLSTDGRMNLKVPLGRAVTDGEGVVVFTDLPPGVTRVIAQSTGGSSGTVIDAEVMVESDGEHRLVLIVPERPVVILTIVDGKGRPSAGKLVQLRDLVGRDQRIESLTDAEGACTFVGIGPGRAVAMVVSKYGKRMVEEKFEIPPGQDIVRKTITVMKEEKERGTLRLFGPESITRGDTVLFDSHSGRFVTGVYMIRWGRGEIKDLSYGTYRVEVRSDSEWAILPELSCNAPVTDVSIGVSFGSKDISGVVVNEEGRPLERAWIVRSLCREDWNGYPQSRSRKDGAFVLRVPDAPDPWFLHVVWEDAGDSSGKKRHAVIPSTDIPSAEPVVVTLEP